jgi:hypothetical protein
MKTATHAISTHRPGFGLLILAACLLFAPPARAGLTFELHIVRYNHGQTYKFFTPLYTNSTPPAAPLGMYFISSPFYSPQQSTNGSWRQMEVTTNGVNTLNGVENGYSDFNSVMQQITNGIWTILFTNVTTTNHYTFTVSAPNMTSNMLPATIITFPSDGALNVTNQPILTWQGPSSWPVNGDAYVYNYDFSFEQYASIPAAQNNWILPISNGMNCTFQINFVTNNTTPIFVATTPLNTNAPHLAISGWSSTSTLETGDNVSFAVTNPPAVGISLIAHYTFDNSGNLGQDTSGNGYDLNFNGGIGVTSSGTAEAGTGAANFDGASFFSYTSTPSNILSTLAGDFTLSFWIKTTQDNGNENGPAWAGAGIVAADVPGQHYDIIPAALDGPQIGFNTGPYDDTINTTMDINNNSYHHVAVTRNQTTGEKRIYIDGALNNSRFATMNPLSDPHLVAIGCQIDASQSNPAGAGTTDYFHGLLDDIQIYSGVLSSSAIAQLYSNPGSTAVEQDFNAALNTTGLTWTTSGDSSWFVETTNTYNGDPAAAQSGSVTGSQSSTLSTTVTGPGTLAFYWSSIAEDSHQGFDYEFYIDDPSSGDQADLYGDNSWQPFGPISIPPGQHTLGWVVYPNGDTDPTQAGFLDQVSYVPDMAPFITLNPFNQTNYPGYNVALLAAATNAANSPITWQWFKVGNLSPIPNATNALYIPTNSGTAGVVGSYYAVASTPGGSTPTTAASVSFVSAPLPPDWTHALKSPFSPVNGSVFNKDYYLGCAADSAGDIYAAAQYNGNMDVLTNGNDANVLTAPGGYGAALVKHSANGSALWAVGLTNNQTGSSYGIAVAVAPGNGAYLASVVSGTNWLGTNKFVDVSGASIVLSRFDANGSNVWSKFIGGTNSVDTRYNMLVSDASGNVTLAGNLSGTASFGGTNLSAPSGGGFIVQYNTNGVVRWAQVVPDNMWGLAYGSGQLYASIQTTVSGGVTNMSIGSLSNVTDRAWALACLNATNGQALWLRGVGEQFGTHAGLVDNVPLISASGSNVFLTGNAYGSSAVFGGLSVSLPGGRSQYLSRYDTNGNSESAVGFGGPTTTLWASAANASGVYVCGDFDNYSQFGSEVIAAPVYAQNDLGPLYFTQPFVAKFDSNGNPLWARNGVSSDLANFRGIALASDGVWAAGFLKISNSIPAQFGSNSVYSDIYIVNVGIFALINWTQAGMIAKITDGGTLTLLNPQDNGTNFQFSFQSQSGLTHAVQYRTNLISGNWQTYSNVTGDGTLKTIPVPLSVFSPSKQGFVRITNAVAP